MTNLNPYRIVITAVILAMLGLKSLHLAAVIATAMEVLYDPLKD